MSVFDVDRCKVLRHLAGLRTSKKVSTDMRRSQSTLRLPDGKPSGCITLCWRP